MQSSRYLKCKNARGKPEIEHRHKCHDPHTEKWREERKSVTAPFAPSATKQASQFVHNILPFAKILHSFIKISASSAIPVPAATLQSSHWTQSLSPEALYAFIPSNSRILINFDFRQNSFQPRPWPNWGVYHSSSAYTNVQKLHLHPYVYHCPIASTDPVT